MGSGSGFAGARSENPQSGKPVPEDLVLTERALESPGSGRLLAVCLLLVLNFSHARQAFAVSSLNPPRSVDGQNQLKSLSLEQLGNIEVVTETKEPTEVWNTPAAIYVLTQEDIRRAGVTNVPDALRLIPGVNVARVSGDRNWVVAIRGLGDQYSKYVLVLIDGRSIYTPLFGGVFWTIDNVMLENIDRIEVIRGPGGTIWGTDAVNGIINIITKSARDTQGLLASAGGGNVDENTEDLRYGGRSHGFDFRLDGFGFVRGPEYHQDGQPNYDWSRLAQVGFRGDRVSGRDYRDAGGERVPGASGGRADDFDVHASRDHRLLAIDQRRWRQPAGALAAGVAGTAQTCILQAYWSHDHRIGPNFGETRDNADVDFLHRTPPTRWQQFTYGAGARWSPSSTHISVSTDRFHPASETESIYSGFLQEELRFVPDRLSLTLGSKLEHNSYTGFEYEPSGRLLFTPLRLIKPCGHRFRARCAFRIAWTRTSTWIFMCRPVWGVDSWVTRIYRRSGWWHTKAAGGGCWGGTFTSLVSGFHNVYDDLIAIGSPAISLGPPPPFPPGIHSGLLSVPQWDSRHDGRL